MKILFMGTPEFAAISLLRLSKEPDLEISVVSTPDKPKGRHMVMTPSDVKKTALSLNLPVYTPETLKDFAFEETLKILDPDLIAVVAYGKILPEYILQYPKYGCINLHGSLLPKYRGAAPMQRMIMEGEKVVGATTMYMAKGLDTGDMLLKYKVELKDSDNLGKIHDLLAVEGAELLLKTIRMAKEGTLRPEKQEDALSTYAEKITKEDCKIDFMNSARTVHNQIRGLSPVPLAFTERNGKKLKIKESEIYSEKDVLGAPGEVYSADKNGIVVCCKEGALRIVTLVPEGKSAMDAAAFVRGRGIEKGDILKTK